ncbi:uncharacterized protein LOC117106921 [Anneissia japonica]|uniref:uncharacterized protein LOC117106921 n=1 Tax=Anneissia japonica TaxID=1529436 RepID=UPI0014256648|nr:uncharacterized protein LOC117106921 [Anneissia japonica]
MYQGILRTIYMKTKHIWRLLMLLFVLTALFVVESILFLPILQWNTNGQSSLPTRSRQERESKIKHAMFRHQLIQEKRNRTKYIRVDSTSLHLPKHLLPLKKSSNTWFSNNASQMLHCEDILEISLVKRIGKGTTKEVWKATYQQKEVAVKLVSKSVDDIRTCMKRVQADEEERRRCYTYANYKLMKEISLLLDLQHSNCLLYTSMFHIYILHITINFSVHFKFSSSLHKVILNLNFEFEKMAPE